MPWNKLAELADETRFMDTPLDVCEQRMIQRLVKDGLSSNTTTAKLRWDSNDLGNTMHVLENLQEPTHRIYSSSPASKIASDSSSLAHA
jgi:hypothetical protein